MTEPHALTVAWLTSVLEAAEVDAHVSTQMDPARGFPQLVVTLAQSNTPTLADGRPDPAVRTVAVAVTAFGTGGDRPDFASTWAALNHVVAAVEALSGSPFETEAGERLVNGSGIVTTRAVDADTNQATYTATFTVTLTAAV